MAHNGEYARAARVGDVAEVREDEVVETEEDVQIREHKEAEAFIEEQVRKQMAKEHAMRMGLLKMEGPKRQVTRLPKPIVGGAGAAPNEFTPGPGWITLGRGKPRTDVPSAPEGKPDQPKKAAPQGVWGKRPVLAAPAVPVAAVTAVASRKPTRWGFASQDQEGAAGKAPLDKRPAVATESMVDGRPIHLRNQAGADYAASARLAGELSAGLMR
ncbi:Hypothetical protein POVN_LOCUS460 [uncultured virus]|nr:Hypothetical protein POVN_LOCUS460 [uncultured virus]